MTIALTRADATPGRLAVLREATASSEGTGSRPRVPLTMPASQTYYWSTYWQRAEAESLTDYQAGDYFESGDADEVIRWLDAPAEDEQD